MIAYDPGDFTPEALAKIAPACAECGTRDSVVIVDGAAIYPNRPDLWSTNGVKRWWWKCGCGAYCGVHIGTLKSLGTPAGRETRKAREAAHAAFDPLWEKRQRLSGLTKTKARGRGYKWLAAQMGLRAKDCHIGSMTAEQARAVVDICNRRKM